MQVEHRIRIAASPASIFLIYQDVQRWHTWDAHTKQVSLEGPFMAGTCGRLTPTRGHAIPICLTQVVADRCFTVESRIPLLRMRFEHELVPLQGLQGTTEVIHRVTLSGPLTIVLGPLLARRLKAGLAVGQARLKVQAEFRR